MGINEYLKVGNQMKEARIKKGLTQKEVANKLNMPKSTYANYENNHREPKFEIIEKIAASLGVTIEYLVGTNPSNKLENDYEIKRGTFIDYLCSLGYSVETPLELLEPDYFPSEHYITHDNECYIVNAIDFSSMQNECKKYISYLINSLLDNTSEHFPRS
jgi:transcriptional regulator with XRE-family HTH domain